jgi:hypothetical protein
MQAAFPSSSLVALQLQSGSISVQKWYQSIEIMDAVDKIIPIYGTVWTPYNHMSWVDTTYCNFKSVGCAFESHRGLKFLLNRSGYDKEESIFFMTFFKMPFTDFRLSAVIICFVWSRIGYK